MASGLVVERRRDVSSRFVSILPVLRRLLLGETLPDTVRVVAEGDEALTSATRAFLEVVDHATRARVISRKRIALTLGVKQNTVSNWFSRNAPPDLGRAHNDLGANKALTDLEVLCDVPSGTFVALYRDIDNARRARKIKDSETRSQTEAANPYLGVTRVHRTFPAASFGRRVEGASRLCIVNNWYPNLSALESSIRKALGNECTMEFTMLNPYCSAAVTRASTLGYRPGSEPVYSVAGEIRESLRGLARIAEESGRREQMGIHLYPEIPALAFYQADDYTLASPFLHGRLAVDGPQFEINSPGSFMDRFVADELARVRSGSMGPVPLPDWEEWLNANL